MGALLSFITTLSPTPKVDKPDDEPVALPPSLEQEVADTVPEDGELPYWQVNVPEDQRKSECPGFLKGITERNRDMIRVPADQFHYQTWEEVKELIGRLQLMGSSSRAVLIAIT